MQQWGREGIYQSQSLLAFALVLAIALPLFVLDLFFIPPATTLFNRNWILVPAMISTATGSVSVRPNCGEDPSLLHHLGKAPFFSLLILIVWPCNILEYTSTHVCLGNDCCASAVACESSDCLLLGNISFRVPKRNNIFVVHVEMQKEIEQKS